MYEDMTFEFIMNRCLNRVSNAVDKREGSIIYDALAPAAVELAIMYMELDTFLDEVFADTASREYLIRRAAERGLTPRGAVAAVVKGVFKPADIDVADMRFSCGGYNYVVTEKIADGEYRLLCETVGSEPNGNKGTLIPIEYIKGLETAAVTEIIIPGEDEEETEAFRRRYVESLRSQAFGGNVADYRQKVMSLEGVGGVKVYRAADWNGAGTVKLVIQGSDYDVPERELISELQTQIDPIANGGEGVGIAPIGHRVTVVGVNEGSVDVTADIKGESGEDVFDEVKSRALEVISEYFKELNASWAEKERITVFSMQIGARLLDIEGVQDVENVRLNDMEGNILLDKDEIIDIGASMLNDVPLKGA